MVRNSHDSPPSSKEQNKFRDDGSSPNAKIARGLGGGLHGEAVPAPHPTAPTVAQADLPERVINLPVPFLFRHLPNPVPFVSCAVITNICFQSLARAEFAKAVFSTRTMATAVSFSLRPALPVQSTSALLCPISASGSCVLFSGFFFSPFP